MNLQYFFLHIPKTGGTSLSAVIEKQFSPNKISPGYNSLEEICAFSTEEFSSYALIRGHYVFNLVEKFKHFPRVIVILRNPVARTISHFTHIRKNPTFWLHEYLPLNQVSWQEAFENIYVQRLFMDHQTRLIGYDFDLHNIREPKMLHSPHKLSRNVLENAKKRLLESEVIGLTEQLSDSVRLICKQFAWPIEQEIPQMNVQPEIMKTPVPQNIISQIKEITQFDIELYQFASELFEERLRKL